MPISILILHGRIYSVLSNKPAYIPSIVFSFFLVMKSTIVRAVAVVLSVVNVSAYPGQMDSLMGPIYAEAYKQNFKRQIDATAPQGTGALPATPPPFDAAAQYVSNQGIHAFVAPGPTDQRGECPGLNALANHGYLPHDGYATIDQFYNATQTVFGMSSVCISLLFLHLVSWSRLVSWSHLVSWSTFLCRCGFTTKTKRA